MNFRWIPHVRRAPWLLGIILLGGCDLPRDPEGTLARVRQGVMRVGWSANSPWVESGGEVPAGTEADLVRAFARSLDARIEWRRDGEQELLADLEKYELDLVICGLTRETPWKKKVGLTRPYTPTGKQVLAVPPGENAWLVKLEYFLDHRETAPQ